MIEESLLLIFVGFIAGVINVLAGGGSLLSLPVLIFLGIPPATANGTNRIAIIIQNIFAVKGFQSRGVHTFPFSIYLAIPATLGAIVGALMGVKIEGELFNKILGVIMVVIVGYMLFKPKDTAIQFVERTHGKPLWISVIVFFLIGVYGGLIHVGVGFMILVSLSSINRISLVKGNAIKVFVALVYSLVALAIFAYHDRVNWIYGLILSLGNASGAWFASRWSVNKGDGFIKKILLIMVLVLAVNLWFPNLYSNLKSLVSELFYGF